MTRKPITAMVGQIKSENEGVRYSMASIYGHDNVRLMRDPDLGQACGFIRHAAVFLEDYDKAG